MHMWEGVCAGRGGEGGNLGSDGKSSQESSRAVREGAERMGVVIKGEPPRGRNAGSPLKGTCPVQKPWVTKQDVTWQCMHNVMHRTWGM